MALVKLTGIEGGNWTPLEDGQVPEEGASVAVPLDRFTSEDESFFDAAGQVGAIVPTDTPYAALAPLANKLAFVEIAFPAFGDGRGFSLAVRLRKDLGFKGEIRASGPVIPDQALFLLRAGFDTVEVTPERKTAFEAALKRFGDFYQTDYTGQVSVAHLRHSNEEERKAS